MLPVVLIMAQSSASPSSMTQLPSGLTLRMRAALPSGFEAGRIDAKKPSTRERVPGFLGCHMGGTWQTRAVVRPLTLTLSQIQKDRHTCGCPNVNPNAGPCSFNSKDIIKNV